MKFFGLLGGVGTKSEQIRRASAMGLALCVLLLVPACNRSQSSHGQPEATKLVIFLVPIPPTDLSADIEMDGVIVASVDRYSATTLTVPPGKRVLKVILEDYDTVQKEVMALGSGGEQKLTFTLKRIDFENLIPR